MFAKAVDFPSHFVGFLLGVSATSERLPSNRLANVDVEM